MLCSYGLVDSRLTVYDGDMGSSSNHKLFLESDGAYVAPPVGVILASASPRDVNLQRQASEETFLQWLIVLQQIFCCFCRACSPMVSVGRRYQHLSVIRSRASCISSLRTEASNVIFMMLLNEAEGMRETPRRIWKSSFLPL